MSSQMKFNQKSHSMNSQPTGISTFAIRTSHRTDPKLQKSFHLCHPKEKLFFKILSLYNF